MFSQDSRYKKTPVVAANDSRGEPVAAVKLRPLGQPVSRPAMITQGDQLDVICQRRFNNATRYWHIADANTELEANSLTEEAGRMIQSPER